MLTFFHLDKKSSHERAGCQVKRPSTFALKDLDSQGVSLSLRQSTKIRQGKGHACIGQDELSGLAIRSRECGAQCLVPPDDFIKTLHERTDIEAALEANGHGSVVGAIRLQLMEEP